MKEFRFFIGSLAVISIFTALTFAQTPKAEKIGFVSWTAFEDENTGIKELVEANKKLDEEFKPLTDQLKILSENYQKKVKELEYFAGCQVINCKSPPTADLIDNKSNELKELENEIKKKQENYKQLYVKRYEEDVVKKINPKIIKGLEQFAKENGFAVILEKSKYDMTMFCIIEEYRNNDVTKEFINFYNADFSKRKG